MQELATYLRFLQFFAHVCHNLTHGEGFFADHAFLGDLYKEYEDLYDATAERAIGLGHQIDFRYVHTQAAALLNRENFQLQEPEVMFASLLRGEKTLCGYAAASINGASEGTKQFLGNICDASESRQYKFKQRIKDPDANHVQQHVATQQV
jgi:DNA-binding ferritin-like protein